MAIFTRFGLQGAFTIAHVIVAIMWMGLLWFFNFVQTPAYAEMDGAARNNAFDKLTWRALWWFRWAAAATVAFGVIIIGVAPKDTFGGDFWKSTAGVTLLIGILFGITMLYNVWMVIWPNQRRIITAVKNGEKPDPGWVGLAGIRSKHNTYMSVPLVFAMISQHGIWAASGDWSLPLVILVGWGFVFSMYKKAATVKGF